jgi:hypothetical protein
MPVLDDSQGANSFNFTLSHPALKAKGEMRRILSKRPQVGIIADPLVLMRLTNLDGQFFVPLSLPGSLGLPWPQSCFSYSSFSLLTDSLAMVSALF